MPRFIEESSRSQSTLFPELLDEHISKDKEVRVIDAFIDNVQNAVDTKYKLIAAHAVTNAPTDRGQLLLIARLVWL